MAAVQARSWRKVLEEMKVSPAWAWPAARYWASRGMKSPRADRRAAVHQPRHSRLPPAESLRQTRHQLAQPAGSRAPRTTGRRATGRAAGLTPGRDGGRPVQGQERLPVDRGDVKQLPPGTPGTAPAAVKPKPSGSRHPGRVAPSFREAPRPSGGGSWRSGGSPIWRTSDSAAPSQR